MAPDASRIGGSFGFVGRQCLVDKFDNLGQRTIWWRQKRKQPTVRQSFFLMCRPHRRLLALDALGLEPREDHPDANFAVLGGRSSDQLV